MTEQFNSYSELADEGRAYIRSLETWLEDFGHDSRRKRPDMEIEQKQRRLAWAEKIVELCDRAAKAREQ